MFKTRFISILALLFGLLPCMSLTAYAASVSYVDGNGTSQTVDATELESTTTSWTDGSWYIVPEGGLTISGRIAVSGTVNLILRDGTELTASAGITTTNATLNIYAQSTGTGALTATGANGASKIGGSAGIGGIGVGVSVSGGAGGTVNIYGGTVTATGGNGGLGGGGGAGIGGGGLGWTSNAGSGAGGTVNIYGGAVTATGGTGGNYSGGAGAGIGRGANGYNSSAGAGGTLTLGVGVKLYNGTDNTGTVLDDNDSESRNYSGSRPKNMFAEVTTYNLTLADGTEDAANWQGKAGEGEYQELPLTGLDAGTAVTVKYNGTKKVKSVKARKKAAALSLTSPSVGQVIGSDGKNYAAASVPSGVTKVAMIAYVSGSNGLAIALADEGSSNWATAKSTCEAKTPAFTNGTWKLPTQDEWNLMFSANGGNAESYNGLNAAINTAGGTTLQSGFYWSSSEYSPGVGAHLVHLDDGDADWSKANEALGRQVRACLAF